MKHIPPKTAREALEIIGGEPHAGHTVMLSKLVVLKVEGQAPVDTQYVECSCGTVWRIDERIAKRHGMVLSVLQHALRNAPLSRANVPMVKAS